MSGRRRAGRGKGRAWWTRCGSCAEIFCIRSFISCGGAPPPVFVVVSVVVFVVFGLFVVFETLRRRTAGTIEVARPIASSISSFDDIVTMSPSSSLYCSLRSLTPRPKASAVRFCTLSKVRSATLAVKRRMSVPSVIFTIRVVIALGFSICGYSLVRVGY